MELKDIYQLWERFENSTVTEMELDFQGIHMKLSTAPTSQPISTANQPADATEPSSEFIASASHKEMKAPLVGVFYPCPAPGEKPYVEEGSSFRKGDVIGIIEAMKMMNEIQATEDGTVEKILVKEGELVEYDQAILTYC